MPAAEPDTPAAAPAPERVLDETDLAAAFLIRETLEERMGIGGGSLAEFVAGPPDLDFLRTGEAPARRPSAVAAAATSPTPPPVAVIEPPEPPSVPITDLLYSPGDAFRRAQTLRANVRTAVVQGDAETADALLDEIFDLIQIGDPAR